MSSVSPGIRVDLLFALLQRALAENLLAEAYDQRDALWPAVEMGALSFSQIDHFSAVVAQRTDE